MKAFLVLAAVLALAACGSDDATDGASEGERVEVTATEFAFEPSTVEVGDGGGATLTLVNEGDLPHALAFEDGPATDTVEGGASTEMSLDLEPGTYTIFCPVGDHRDRGMEGTFVVAGATGAGGGTQTGESGGSKPANDYGYG